MQLSSVTHIPLAGTHMSCWEMAQPSASLRETFQWTHNRGFLLGCHADRNVIDWFGLPDCFLIFSGQYGHFGHFLREIFENQTLGINIIVCSCLTSTQVSHLIIQWPNELASCICVCVRVCVFLCKCLYNTSYCSNLYYFRTFLQIKNVPQIQNTKPEYT